MNKFMSNLVCEGFSSCSTYIYGHENGERKKKKKKKGGGEFDDVTL